MSETLYGMGLAGVLTFLLLIGLEAAVAIMVLSGTKAYVIWLCFYLLALFIAGLLGAKGVFGG